MASLQEPEVQLAQRLASNQKPIRTRAMKKLRKYVQVRSQKVGGGFTLDELLKLWKGLFYCLWMQDKPLLQMDLSKIIASMIHNFHDLDAQLLYLRASLQTFKREWNGIDRLRMDKFFQLVRYMFHQSFELLRRKTWDSRGVDGFLQVVHDELLRSGCEAPSGLQIHVLDVYLTELAAVGAQELNADQNLQFIQPFCKIAAETKNMLLFKSICNNIFSTITNQAPFAIEDLIQELKRAKTSSSSQDSDSGQASDEGMDSEDQVEIQKEERDNIAIKQMNGIKPLEVDDDDLVNLEDSEVPPDEDDISPVLQFDYGAVADKLLELASRQKVPSCNRKKLYSIIKTFRNLSEGIFPQEHRPAPQEPSSDEEDEEMLDSRNILKRAREMLGVGDGAPAAKKKKKKRRRRKKKGQSPTDGLDREEGGDDESEQLDKQGKEKGKKKTKLTDDQQNSEVKERAAGQTPVLDLAGLADLNKEPAPSSLTAQPEGVSDTAAKGGREKKEKKKKKKKEEEEQEEGCGDDEVPTDSAETGSGGVPGATASQPSVKEEAHQRATDPSLPGDVDTCHVNEETSTSASTVKAKLPVKRKKCLKNTLSLNSVEAEGCDSEEGTPQLIRKKRKSEVRAHETLPNTDEGLGLDVTSSCAKKKQAAVMPETGGSEASVTKKKIPVVFEFEADDVANGAGELTDPSEDVAVLKPMNSKGKTKLPKSGFVTFQEKSRAPTPLFCRTKAGQETPKASKKVKKIPKSESKKVTFHLLKNQTAEFRKSDRSLLLSPHGASRVAFDPEQKPKSGVLKSPPTPDPTCTMPARRKTTVEKTRRRPSAADFF
ncbi:ribosomal RNA processing protein 1 homolog A-like [Synchiropus splendidus]|uniref:ribosomal RNA processing protein 1 homolog A-like n=1 Tax=Synchiropus splendidus TaxID=270530 RepID=UPI00237D8C6E|nr:ribosomal RNA processing protein 1 homolog A-like [Synchiropus splendidus]